MNRKFSTLLAIALGAILYGASPVSAQISLGSAQSFGVLGASTVTNTGATTVTGDLGVSPGTAVTGFPPGVIVGGALHSADAAAAKAQTDVTTAWNAITGTACTADLTGQDLGARTLTPGVYCFSAAAGLTGTLTLDFQGNQNATFLFKTGSTLITASGSSVALINSGGGTTCPPNLYWQVGSSATLGTGTTFVGNILAQASITLSTGAKVNGRALARTAAVTLDTNTVTAGPPPPAPPLSLGSAQSFRVLGASTVTNTGATSITVTGDIGVSPGTAITGFPPGVVVGGAIHGGDATAAQAQTDVTTAWNAITGTACTLDLTGQDLGGRTLTPGVYCFSSSAGLTGTLTLDFQGDPNATFLFKTGSTLITASASSVALINRGDTTCPPPNLYWQVGSSATLGTGTKFVGNIIAQASITLTTGARVDGRALARTAAVTMDTNTVTACDFSTITSVVASASGVYPPGTTYGAVPISAVNLSSSVEVGPTGTALGEVTVTLVGTGIAGLEQDILVEAEVNAGSRSQANLTTFSGLCTIDMGDGTPPLPGIPFSATIASDGSGLGTLALVLGATPLPVANINDGTIVLKYR